MKWLLIVLIVVFLAIAPPVSLLIIVAWIAWKVYQWRYYKSDEFIGMKRRVSSFVSDCNELNEHIEELESTSVPGMSVQSVGKADYHDASRWNFKRREFNRQTYAGNVHNCSRTVCDNARKSPIKYVCKYFNIKATPETLNAYENLVNNFSAAIDGKSDLTAKHDEILEGLEIPKLIKRFGMERFERELGFEDVDLKSIDFPYYRFQYISSGGNSHLECDVVMDLDNLEAMTEYLDGRIKWKKSVKGQRALMTPALRRNILQRDGFTCKKCGASLAEEPHLLLEVDHIIPVSKGGLTCADNLQTLCWKCNRKKGAKVE